jgi:DNA (cytosine-5)-methyltransferase 1
MSELTCFDGCCAQGGAGWGYHLAGLVVTGMDIVPQPRYPLSFILGDVFEYLAAHGKEYDLIHVSPPCQEYSKSTKQWRKAGKQYPDLIAPLRRLLVEIGKPYVIENVPGSPLINPVLLNGPMFGVHIHKPRLFECSFDVPFLFSPSYPAPIKMGRPVQEGDYLQPVGHFSGVDYARREMGCAWMDQGGLAQAILPVYTKYIGECFLQSVKNR